LLGVTQFCFSLETFRKTREATSLRAQINLLLSIIESISKAGRRLSAPIASENDENYYRARSFPRVCERTLSFVGKQEINL